MCGIVGIVGNQNVAGQLYDGLTVLQHRGQDAAGIATADGTRLRVHKDNGLVRDVFNDKAMTVLEGKVGIAHCRYPTAGSEGLDEAQPFYVNSPYGIALAHNGNLINTEALRQDVFAQDRRNINTDSDSEVLLNVFAHELDTQRSLTPEAIDEIESTDTDEDISSGCSPSSAPTGSPATACTSRPAREQLPDSALGRFVA